MDCIKAQNLLSEFLDGRLPESDAQAIRAHLYTCQACTDELASLQATVTRVKSLGSLAAPEGFTSRVSAAVRQQAKDHPASHSWLSLRLVAPSAIVLLLGLGLWLNSYYKDSSPLTAHARIGMKRTAPDSYAGPFADWAAPLATQEMEEATSEHRMGFTNKIKKADKLLFGNKTAVPPPTGMMAGKPAPSAMKDERLYGSGKAAGSGIASQSLPAQSGPLSQEAFDKNHADSIATVVAPSPKGLTAEEKVAPPGPSVTAPAAAGAVATRNQPTRERTPSADIELRTPFVAQNMQNMNQIARRSLAPSPEVRIGARADTNPSGQVVVNLRFKATRPEQPYQIQVDTAAVTNNANRSSGANVILSPENWRSLKPITATGGSSAVWSVVVADASQAALANNNVTNNNVFSNRQDALPGRSKSAQLPRPRQEYRIFVPSHLSDREPQISISYRDLPYDTAWRDLSEKAGVVIVAPARFDRITIDLKSVPSNIAITRLADSLGLVVTPDKSSYNLSMK
jgi:hypothetical protein